MKWIDDHYFSFKLLIEKKSSFTKRFIRRHLLNGKRGQLLSFHWLSHIFFFIIQAARPSRGVTHDSHVYVRIVKKNQRVYFVSVGLVLFKDKYHVLAFLHCRSFMWLFFYVFFILSLSFIYFTIRFKDISICTLLCLIWKKKTSIYF